MTSERSDTDVREAKRENKLTGVSRFGPSRRKLVQDNTLIDCVQEKAGEERKLRMMSKKQTATSAYIHSRMNKTGKGHTQSHHT